MLTKTEQPNRIHLARLNELAVLVVLMSFKGVDGRRPLAEIQ